MKYTYLDDLITETEKDDKLKSDIIYVVYDKAMDYIHKEIRKNDYVYDSGLSWADKTFYDCFHPKLYKLMFKLSHATNLALEITGRIIKRFNHGKGIYLDAFDHLGAPVDIDKVLIFDLNDDELCKMFNEKIDEICKLCKEIKGDNHHERKRC